MDTLERIHSEDHTVVDGEPPHCAQGYCCGCDVHPIAKPWGWNHARWDRHYATHHQPPEKDQQRDQGPAGA